MKNPEQKEKDATSFLDHVIGLGRDESVSSIDSLTGALNTGFRVLRILMILLAIVFLFSNIYWVPEGSIAVHTRFGEILGRGDAALRRPGGPYLAFPFPMDKVIRIPTGIQKVGVFRAFWMETEEFEPVNDDRPETEELQPGVNGSLITADNNIVQGTWLINYKLDAGENVDPTSAASDFVQSIGSMEQANEIIRSTAQSAIIRVVSRTRVADFVAGQLDNRAIKEMISAQLKGLNSGLTVTGVTAGKYAVPRKLMSDFQAVNQAESQKALSIEKASRQRTSTLNELAGSGWQELLDAIEAHERALQNKDRTAEAAAFDLARKILLTGDVGGAVKQIMDEARSEKTSTIQQARASAARFTELLPEYNNHEDVLKAQLVQDTIQKIWSDISVDALYVPPGQKLFLDLGPSNQMDE